MLPSKPDLKGNPYAPPGTPGVVRTGEPGTTVAPYRRVAAMSLLLGAGFGVFLGTAQTLQFGTGLTRFGGLTYVPRVVVLTTVRALGAGAAMLVTSVSTAIVLHQIGRVTPGVTVARDRRTLWLGAATVATFVVVCAFAALAAALTSAVAFSTGVTAFLGEGWRTLTLRDLVHGAALAAVDAVIVAVLLPLVSGWMTAPKRSLLMKLFVAYATVQATTIVEQTLLALLER
jgi:hypothetical protein